MTGDAVQTLWDTQAAQYDSAYDAPGRRGALVRARLAAAAELLGDAPGRVLDVGMGAGRLCAELAARGFEVTGVDASDAMVELARRRLPERADSLVRAQVERLPFADGSFDAVIALGVLEYSAEVGAALVELARVLRGGGTAVVSWPNFAGLPTIWRRRVLCPGARAAKRIVPVGGPVPPPPRHPLGESRFLALMGDAGLEPTRIVRLGAHGRPGHRLLAVQILVGARKA